MSRPMISVVIPVYNVEKHLPGLMHAVLSQLPEESEVILINDGSRDGSLSVCRALAQEDVRIRVLDQANAGPGAARNAGLDVATGEYLLFVDSDDMLLDGAVPRMLDAMQGSDLAIAAFVFNLNRVASVRSLVRQDCTMDKPTFLKAYVRRPGSFYFSVLWNKMYRRDIVEARHIRFRTDIGWGEDFVFNAQYCSAVERVAFVRDSVYQYNRSTKGQVWRTLFSVHRNIRVKAILYQSLRTLYREQGLYRRYWWYVNRYIFNATLFN